MAAMRVEVNPKLLRWARERARLEPGKLEKRFPRLPDWESGKTKPTLRQLENFADATAVPIGYLFLPEPPEEPLPIPDFRTLADKPIGRPTPNLLDTVFEMQRRQAWLRDERIEEDENALSFVGSATAEAAPERVAGAI